MAKPTKAFKKRRDERPGPDGTVEQTRVLRTGTMATATLRVRCKPGTFDWRYGKAGSSQYHAGAEFARIWERAGIASCGPTGLGGGTSGDSFRGLPDGRIRALDRVNKISRDIGGPMTRRLVAYCVEGRTPKEIAASYNGQVTDRQLSDTLDLDLIELARTMGYAA